MKKKSFLLILVKAKFCLSSLCNGDNIYLVVNEKKREKNCKFKGNNKNVNFSSWICLGSIPNKFDYAKSEEVSLKGNVYHFSIDYYPFMVSLSKCSESLNSVDDWYTKIWILTETKDIYVNLFNMITKSNNEAKIIVKHNSCDWKCEFSSSICNSYQKWNNDKFQWECKKYCTCKNDYTWNPSACICDNGKYLKTFIDDSNCVWWYYIRYKYCISKCHEYSFNKFWS